jgi:hypothetical protein
MKRYIRLTVTMACEDDTPAHASVLIAAFEVIAAKLEQNASSGTFVAPLKSPGFVHPDVSGEFYVSHGVVGDDGR